MSYTVCPLLLYSAISSLTSAYDYITFLSDLKTAEADRLEGGGLNLALGNSRLREILQFINEEEYLKDHLLLKGGTTINLTTTFPIG